MLPASHQSAAVLPASHQSTTTFCRVNPDSSLLSAMAFRTQNREREDKRNKISRTCPNHQKWTSEHKFTRSGPAAHRSHHGRRPSPSTSIQSTNRRLDRKLSADHHHSNRRQSSISSPSSLPNFVAKGGGAGIFQPPARAAVHPSRPPSLELRRHPLRETQIGIQFCSRISKGRGAASGKEKGMLVQGAPVMSPLLLIFHPTPLLFLPLSGFRNQWPESNWKKDFNFSPISDWLQQIHFLSNWLIHSVHDLLAHYLVNFDLFELIWLVLNW